MTNEITTQNQEVITLTEQLKKRTIINFYEIPEEYRYHPSIVKMERELGMRKSIRKGYDIIRNAFFVDEHVEAFVHENDELTSCFDDFSAYYDFLQGDIYEKACYYGYRFSQEQIDRHSLDLSKLNFQSLIESTIDDFTIDFSQNEIVEYQEKETRKEKLGIALAQLNACTTYDEFDKQLRILASQFIDVPNEFFLSNFITYDKEKAFTIVMEYINHTYSNGFEETMCLIYEPEAVLAAYKNTYYTYATAKKYEKRLKEFISEMENSNIERQESAYFDEKTHYFVVNTIWSRITNSKFTKTVELKRYFETFEALMEYRKNDLSYCDLSKAIIPDLDLSKYKIGEHTFLPIQYQNNLRYSLQKLYDIQHEHFVVKQNWCDPQGVSIKSHCHTFKHFFDFVYFLRGDLSDADLLFCDGLVYIHDFTGLNLNNARLQSAILDKLGVKYEIISIPSVTDFSIIQQNEDETNNALMLGHETYSVEESLQFQTVYYISDLHLIHRLINAKCKNVNDVICTIQRIIETLLNEVTLVFADQPEIGKNIMLVGGDIASDFSIFKQFISMLRKSLDDRRLDIKIIFVLGNHELWDFSQCDFEKIVATYRHALAEEGMFLLQNNIIFKYNWNEIGEISTEELNTLSSKELHDRLSEARIILFGGLAFSGYNNEFNANQFIYRDAINRQQEVEETKKFETLYHKVCADLPDKRVIVFTHMPQKDWCADAMPKSGFVYVNGHTHRNYFYDDGDYRIYADNQIGYKNNTVHLKHFYIDDDYDTFGDYEDGIYELSREQYTRFCEGKNIGITFNREFYKLFMLKKSGYYMFVVQNPSGGLLILNGGALKRLEHKDIHYYYDKMDEVIVYIKSPLDKFTECQKKISEAIKAIGGSGTIHGAIVDIDFLNHIYVNPLDFTITPYFATDIINKKIFPDTPTLLQNNCPVLYTNYLKQIEGKSSFALALLKKEKGRTSVPQLYLDTDIYHASREIKKMQKLCSNILSTWIEPPIKKLRGKKKK